MPLLDLILGRSDQDVFAAALVKRLKQQGRRSVRYDRARFALSWNGEWYPLVSAFLAAAPYPLTSTLLDGAIEAVFDPEPDLSYGAVRDRLLPVVGNRAINQLHDFDVGSELRDRRPLAEFLEIFVVIDRPHSSRAVRRADTEAWGASFEDLLEVAIANLLDRPAFPFKPMKDGFYVVGVEDHYDSARILLPHIFDQLDLQGEPVVVVISQNRVAVAGRNDHRAIATMVEYVGDLIRDEPKPIASAPIVRDGGDWTPLIPRADDAACLRRLVISQDIMDYEAQTEWLAADYARRGIKVAPFNVAQDGRSWVEWSPGGFTLLPKADAIVLTEPAHDAVVRTWDDAERVLGPFEKDPDLYPPRYLVPTWSQEAKDQLEADFALPPWMRKD